MPTLESETAKGNYSYQLSDQDIRNIVNIGYTTLYNINIVSNSHVNTSRGLRIISDQLLDSEIAQFKENFHDGRDIVSLQTFIINLRDYHWVTLVLLHQNGMYYGYYVDSLYNKDRVGNECNTIPDGMKGILVSRDVKIYDLKIHQQEDGINCGLFALENAKDINDILKRGLSIHEMFQRLQVPRDNNYFIERRKYLTSKLSGNQGQDENVIEGPVFISDGDSLVAHEKLPVRHKVDRFVKNEGICSLQDRLYGCDQYTFAKMRGYFSLIGIVYQLQLLIFCFYRMFIVHKYDTISLATEKIGVGKFDDIVLSDKNGTTCIQVKYVDEEKAYKSIGFIELFPRGKRKWEGMFSVNRYFHSFIQSDTDNVKHLIIYTNMGLDLTKGKKLSQSKWSIVFFPLEFDVINIEKEKYKIVKDCLYTGGSTGEHCFYQFSQKKITRKTVLKLLDPPPSIVYNTKEINKMKKNFLDKLIFAVNQPSREKLNSIIKHEIEKSNGPDKVSYIYNDLYEGMLHYLASPDGMYIAKRNAGNFFEHMKVSANMKYGLKQGNTLIAEYKKASGLRNYVPHIMYKLELLKFSLYRMYKNKLDKLFISVENGRINISSSICFHYKGKTTYLWTRYGSEGYVDYSKLFPNTKDIRREMFSINRYFNNFIKLLDTEIEGIEHIVIYTNMGLNVTEEGELENMPIRFDHVDIKKHAVLRDYLCVDDCIKEHGFYQFSRNKKTVKKLLDLLDTHNFYYDANKLKEIKMNFLDKLVLAVNQPGRDNFCSIIKHEIKENSKHMSADEILHKYIALQEVVLRWLGAYKVHYITRKRIKKLFKDIKSNRSSDKDTRIPDGNKDKFARTVVCHTGLCHFREFREFLDTKEGVDMLNVLYKNKAEYNISGMLGGTGIGVIDVFRRLYYTLFYKDGEKTDFFRNLEESGVTLSNISSILHGAGDKAVEALKALYTTLNTKVDNERTYLEFFIEKNIMTNISSILHRAGAKAPDALKALYKILSMKLDDGRTYLEFFVEKRIMTNISSILNGAGDKAPEALAELYNMLSTKLVDEKTYVEFFVEKRIMTNISSMLNGAGDKAPEAIRALHEILIMELDNGKSYLEFFVEKNIMRNISSILHGAGHKAAKALKALCAILNTRLSDGKTYLEFFVEKKIMENISSMLSGTGDKAPKALRALYTILNTSLDNGETYLEFFVRKNIMGNISSIVSGARDKASKTLKELCAVLRTKLDDGKTYLEFFAEKNIVQNISSMLNRSGSRAPETLKELYTILNKRLDSGETYLEFFVRKSIMGNISSILSGAGDKAPEALKALCFVLGTKLNNNKTYLEFFVEKKIMKNISSILNRAGNKAPETLEELYTVLNAKLDNGETCLEFFVQNNIMGNISSILHGTGSKAPEALKAFCSILNMKLDNGKTYLELFAEKNVMANISSILSGAGARAPEALEALYAILNTKLNSDKTYLEFFVEKDIMGNISSMLSKAGRKAPEALKALYVVLGIKSDSGKTYLEFFVENNIMGNISSILHGAGNKAPEALREIHAVLGTKLDDEKTYLEYLIANNIMGNVSSMLNGTGNKAPKALKALCTVLNTKLDCTTTYLDFLIEKNIMENISSMLGRSGNTAPEVLIELCTVLNTKLDDEKTYLEFFAEQNIMGNISSMLNRAGRKAPGALKEVYNLLFNEKYLEHFVKEGFKLSNLSNMLNGTGACAPHVLKSVHDLCFDVKGNKTPYFSDLMNANHKPAKLFSMLRKAAVTALGEKRTSGTKGDKTMNAGYEPSNLSCRVVDTSQELDKTNKTQKNSPQQSSSGLRKRKAEETKSLQHGYKPKKRLRANT